MHVRVSRERRANAAESMDIYVRLTGPVWAPATRFTGRSMHRADVYTVCFLVSRKYESSVIFILACQQRAVLAVHAATKPAVACKYMVVVSCGCCDLRSRLAVRPTQRQHSRGAAQRRVLKPCTDTGWFAPVDNTEPLKPCTGTDGLLRDTMHWRQRQAVGFVIADIVSKRQGGANFAAEYRVESPCCHNSGCSTDLQGTWQVTD